jgi:hypothetical protein
LIFVLFVRAFGAGGWYLDRILSILHLWGVYHLFQNCCPYRTVNENLYSLLAFWCCFIQLNPPKGARIPAWGPLLLGISMGIIFFTSGLDKLQDYFWANGVGFMKFASLPWIRHPTADWLMNYSAFLSFMNWAALGMELAALPLMFHPRTRAWACLLYFGFFFSLIWPFRMDMIGPVGICMTLLVLAGSVEGIRCRMNGLAWVLAFYVGIVGADAVIPLMSRRFLSNSTDLTISKSLADLVSPSFRWLSDNVTMIGRTQLFSAQHIAHLYAFRVIVVKADGTTAEPVRVFNPDRSGGPDTQGLACTRHFQACIYDITANMNIGDNRGPAGIALMKYAIKKAHGVSAKMLVSFLDDKFEGWQEAYNFTPPPPPPPAPFPWRRFGLFLAEIIAFMAAFGLLRTAWQRGWFRRLMTAKLL